MFDSAFDELVEANALSRSRFDSTCMKLGIDAGIEAAGEMAHRIDTVLAADVEEYGQGLGSLGLERGDVARVKWYRVECVIRSSQEVIDDERRCQKNEESTTYPERRIKAHRHRVRALRPEG